MLRSSSVERMMTVSTQPPKYPATPPSSSPSVNEIAIPTSPTVSQSWEPWGRIEEARPVHLLLGVRRQEGGQEREEVERREQSTAEHPEVAAAELAPEQLPRRPRRHRSRSLGGPRPRGLSHRRSAGRRSRAGDRRPGCRRPAPPPPSGPSP